MLGAAALLLRAPRARPERCRSGDFFSPSSAARAARARRGDAGIERNASPSMGSSTAEPSSGPTTEQSSTSSISSSISTASSRARCPRAGRLAALETQAICARTYVLQRSDPRRSYDLVPSELDQVYDGIAGETRRRHRGRRCDGRSGAHIRRAASRKSPTRRAAADIPSRPRTHGATRAIPYLAGVVCTSCSDSPNYRWQRTLTFDAIAARLSTSLAPLAKLDDVRDRANAIASGRARTFELVTDRGDAIVAGSAFRRAIGSRVLPSLLLTNLQPHARR